MQLLALALSTAVCGAIVSFLGRGIAVGLRTGKIQHTGDRICDRRKNPVGFWALVLLFTGFIALFIFGWYRGFLVYTAGS